MDSKAFTEMSAEEQLDHLKQLNAQVEHKDDDHKQAMDEEKKNHESALKAQEDEHKKEAQDDEKKNHDAQEDKDKKLEAAILKAMEEPDKEKREAAIRSAMEDHMKKNHEGQDNDEHKKEAQEKDDEEKKAMRAEITYLNAERNAKKIKHLESIYKAAQTPEETLKEYKAEWEKMTPKQLDAAVEHIKPLISTLELSADKPSEEDNPFGWKGAQAPAELSASVSDKRFDKIDKMSDSELFGGNN